MKRLNPYITPLSVAAMERCFANSHHVSMLHINSEDVIVNCNNVFCSYFGYEKKEIVGQHISRILVGDALCQLEKDMKTPLSNKLPVILAKTKQGQIAESHYSLFEMKLSPESPIEDDPHYIMLFHDLNDKLEGFGLHQLFPGTFMKDVNLGIMIVDMDFILRDISDIACKILGVEREIVLNKTMEDVFLNVPIEHQFVQRTLLEGQVLRNHAISWTNNHERYELLMDSNLFRNHCGETIGAYIIFKDVSNLRSLEEQVLRSDRLAMIGQISAGTAHEIRNPLTSIKGFLQILNKTLHNKGMEKEHQYTEIMLDEIDRINNLVSEFLLLSKPKDTALSKVNFSAVIREILPIINNEALLHNVTVQYETKYNLPFVLADRELLKQVCLNISKNGIEAMGDGGGILTLVEDIDAEKRRVYIEIHDTGPGIPAFLIDKIFDPFFTTKEKGTGLGLSVCQRIIHDMGGTIRVSTKGFGTTFSISVPYSDD